MANIFEYCASCSRFDSLKCLLDDSICPRQHIRRNRQTDLLGRFQIDDELKLARLRHWKFGGLGAFQNPIHIRRGAPEQVGKARAIGHQSTAFHPFCRVIDGRQPVLYRKLDNLFSMRSGFQSKI